MDTIRKLGFTAYGKVGGDAVRVSLAVVAGATVFVREDGSNAVLPVRPTRFITSGAVSTITAHSGESVSMAALPWSMVATAHEWKRGVTLKELAMRKSYLGWTEAKVREVKAALKASYQDMVDEDAELIAA